MIPAADAARLVDEDGAVENLSADALGQPEGQADLQLPRQFAEAADHGAAHGQGHLVHALSRLLAGNDRADHVPLEHPFRGHGELGPAGRGLAEHLFQPVCVFLQAELLGDERYGGCGHLLKHETLLDVRPGSG